MLVFFFPLQEEIACAFFCSVALCFAKMPQSFGLAVLAFELKTS